MFEQKLKNQGIHRISFFTFAIIFLNTAVIFGQLKPIPKDDKDIDRIIERIFTVQNLARQCQSKECHKTDCAGAQQAFQRIRDARIALRYAFYWNDRAADAQMQHFKSLAIEGLMASDRAARLQKMIAWQEWVVGISSGLLDVASVGSSFDEIVNNPKLLEKKSFPEMLELLDTFYEGLKDAEGLYNDLAAARHDRDFPKPIADLMPGIGNLTSKDMNNLKSTVSDLASLMKAANEHGRDWRKILKEGKGARSIGQIVGRVLKIYAESDIKGRKELVATLINEDLETVTDIAQSQSFKDLARIQTRRNKAEAAYLALTNLIISGSGSGGEITSCLLRAQRQCPSFDLSYASKWKAPEEIEVEDFNIVTERDSKKSWGLALLTVNALLPDVEKQLAEIPQFTAEPELTLNIDKTTYKPKAVIAVTVSGGSCVPPETWVGVASSQLEGTGDEPGQNKTETDWRLLSDLTNETIFFTAPDKPGSYEIQVRNRKLKTMVASVSFIVANDDNHSFSGYWKLYLGPSEVWDKQSDDLVRFVVNGDRVEWGFVTPTEPDKWRKDSDGLNPVIGKIEGDTITTTWTMACGYGPGGRTYGEMRNDVPLRLILSSDGRSIVWQQRKIKCDSNGRMSILNDWQGVSTWDKPWTLFRIVQ